MLTEGELSMVEDSDSVRELQDRIGELKAEVNSTFSNFFLSYRIFFLNRFLLNTFVHALQIQRLEHVNRKLSGNNVMSKLAASEVLDPSDDDEDMSKLELRLGTSVENLTS